MRPGNTRLIAAFLVLSLSVATQRTEAQGPPGMPFPPGGMGGGPGGMNGPSLVMAAPVQDDLGMTDKQKTQIKKLKASMDQQMRQLFQNAREEGSDPQEMMTTMTSLNREHTAAVMKVLDKTQKARLAQLELQREGLLAVAKPDLATKLKLNSPQNKKIKTIVDEIRQVQFRGLPGLPADAPGVGPKGKAATKNARRPPPEGGGDAGNGDMPPGGEGFPGGGPPGFGGPGGGPPGGMPDFNNEEFRAQFAKRLEAIKKSREEAIVKIGEVLTPEQSAAFDKMIGKPFDFSKIQFGPPPGKPPGEDTPKDDEEMQKKDAPAKADPKTKSRKTANE